MLDRLKEKVSALKRELSVLRIAYNDKRTPFLAKLMLGLTIGYLLSPIDLIPDFIPVLGLLDDLIIVPLLIKVSIRLIPVEVIEDARKQLLDQPQRKEKTNWVGAIVIAVIWVMLGVIIYRWIRGKSN